MEPVSAFNTLNIILGALLALSEVLALTPLKSNSVFQLVVGAIKRFTDK